MITKIKYIKIKFLYLSISTTFIFLLLDASRLDISKFGFLKYFFIGSLAFITLLINAKKIIIDTISSIGLYFFLIFTSIYTFTNQLDLESIIILLGYWTAALIFTSSTTNHNITEKSLDKTMYFTGVATAAINIFSLIDPAAYTIHKNQFTGVFNNPNFLAGISSCYLLYFFFREKSKNSLLDYLIAIVFLILIINTFSRSSILSITLVYIIFYSRRNILISILILFLAFSALYYLSNNMDYAKLANRDLLEDTGRIDILNRYIAALKETFLITGTGVNTEHGRIKSELSYLDIILFSGVGAMGFFVFIGRSIYLIIKDQNSSWSWIEAVYLNVIIISLFEGYAANVASIPSLLLYLLSAILISKRRIKNA